MKQRIEREVSGLLSSVVYLLVLVFSVLYINAANIYAQEPVANTEQASYTKKKTPLQTPESAPVLKDYRKVSIGMSGDMLREIWGKPAMEYPDGFLYEMSDSETVQIVIDTERKITAISVTFVNGKGAPAYTKVFGESAVPDKSENGSIYKMVRYENAGYWVAYSVGPGEDATVSVTMQKF